MNTMTPEQVLTNLPAMFSRMEKLLNKVELSKRKWLTKEEAMDMLGVKETKLKGLVKAGKIEVNQNPELTTRKNRYLRTSIEEYLDNPKA